MKFEVLGWLVQIYYLFITLTVGVMLMCLCVDLFVT